VVEARDKRDIYSDLQVTDELPETTERLGVGLAARG